MFYLVIDSEMCRVPRDYRNKAYHYAYETIQIGAVLLNEEFKQVGTIREYVHPEHGVIDSIYRKTDRNQKQSGQESTVYWGGISTYDRLDWGQRIQSLCLERIR